MGANFALRVVAYILCSIFFICYFFSIKNNDLSVKKWMCAGHIERIIIKDTAGSKGLGGYSVSISVGAKNEGCAVAVSQHYDGDFYKKLRELIPSIKNKDFLRATCFSVGRYSCFPKDISIENVLILNRNEDQAKNVAMRVSGESKGSKDFVTVLFILFLVGVLFDFFRFFI